MSAEHRAPKVGADAARSWALVWIDAAEAVIVRLEGGVARLERIESEVPAHHRSTGHVRHVPGVRHGGGGPPQTAGEPRRIEHLKRFVADTASRVAPTADLLILGPGTVHEHLAHELKAGDAHAGRQRTIIREASRRLTDRQLVARLRHLAGAEPRRRSVGAYRWTVPLSRRPSGRAVLLPHRVIAEAPPERRPLPRED